MTTGILSCPLGLLSTETRRCTVCSSDHRGGLGVPPSRVTIDSTSPGQWAWRPVATAPPETFVSHHRPLTSSLNSRRDRPLTRKRGRRSPLIDYNSRVVNKKRGVFPFIYVWGGSRFGLGGVDADRPLYFHLPREVPGESSGRYRQPLTEGPEHPSPDRGLGNLRCQEGGRRNLGG